MLGVSRFTAVINPPQAAILAVGAATPRAVGGRRRDRQLRRVMELTISADHRIVYGADAADFLAHRPQAPRAPGRAAALIPRPGTTPRSGQALLERHDIALVRAPNPGPYTLNGTNSWIVGRDPAYVIDPGPALARRTSTRCSPSSTRAAARPRSWSRTTTPITPARSRRSRARTGAPVAAMRAGAEIALDRRRRVVGPLTAFETPGHAPDHVVLLAGRVLFSGDHVLGEGSVVIGAEPGALAGYLASLRRLRELDLELIAPGHGPLDRRPARQARRVHRAPPRPRAPDRARRARRGAAPSTTSCSIACGGTFRAALRPGAASTLAAHLGEARRRGTPARLGRPPRASARGRCPRAPRRRSPRRSPRPVRSARRRGVAAVAGRAAGRRRVPGRARRRRGRADPADAGRRRRAGRAGRAARARSCRSRRCRRSRRRAAADPPPAPRAAGRARRPRSCRSRRSRRRRARLRATAARPARARRAEGLGRRSRPAARPPGRATRSRRARPARARRRLRGREDGRGRRCRSARRSTPRRRSWRR